jgi:hypothetical protein
MPQPIVRTPAWEKVRDGFEAALHDPEISDEEFRAVHSQLIATLAFVLRQNEGLKGETNA